ncbi:MULTISPECIES: hypothetical protein [unclassified Gilliamella]|uniref:hypothetical protein n=1 Tax=unclassified Gilliamella TaxID=2685620 RepID=UPI00226A2F7F|nr:MULTISPECIES: hypothetical protein [unclassified Gilliamella]MCX8575549.1 hypothetical protein [Gilliamella sp. B3831]MCX8577780.1 hypothetical protein [Gilliamella sp. B3815]MCX8590619.1 hypothetical protein [Gilliamella sp. B3812]MCX8604874.1 hypothetical protein [Gilliamella sp. B3823]MCX8606179.1 hypothetical protein [Gilliamella sp. B3825]
MTKVTFNFGGVPVEIEGEPLEYKEPIVEENEYPKGASWWRIKPVGDKYLFSCISGSLAGGEYKTEITKEEFDKLHTGEVTAKDICYKYNIG